MILILDRGKLTYYDEIRDELHDTNKDDINKADDISVEVDDSRRPMKLLRIIIIIIIIIILLDRTAHIMAFTSEFYIFNIIGQVLISSSFLPPDPQCPSPQNIEQGAGHR